MRRIYIFGNPETRQKINFTLRVVGMSIVLGLACIGFGVLLITVIQILAW